MRRDRLSAQDYPLAENRPDLVRGQRGKSLDVLNLATLESGDVVMEDLRITAGALEMQAGLARTVNRSKLADNFERAAELVDIPQDYLMVIYELLRPGRARDKVALQNIADDLRSRFKATRMAEFIEEAAEVYERRGLFTSRY
jgi:propanediol dehydratase small subunit|tara:strand:+ start:315 stop:743 length:429 start_codon:yes stop_codon:yes gene_type:complete